uniref:Uncharacterized protein n=1 Tax=Oryza nivara TaxID=4536 RepID=A0A0E0J322_ORYNI
MGPTSIGTTWAASPFWANKFQVSRFSPSSPSFFLPRSEIHRRRRRSKLRRRLHYSRRRVLAASSVSDECIKGGQMIKESCNHSENKLQDYELLKVAQPNRYITLHLDQNPEFWEAQEAIWDITV